MLWLWRGSVALLDHKGNIMTINRPKWLAATVGASLGVLVCGSASATYAVCADGSSHACWHQITYTNFKDFAVGNNIVCMVGGNSPPTVGSDAYLNPNAHSDNLGNEDIVECHNPDGVSGINSHPIYVGYGSNSYSQNRVPGGVYDDGVWGGVPTGVIALYGTGGDDVAVLNSQQYLYVSAGDSTNPWAGGNYSTYVLDRQNIDATTGATICLKGIYSYMPPATGSDYRILGLSCTGQIYVVDDKYFAGWTLADSRIYTEPAGGQGVFYGLKPSNQVVISAYRTFLTLGAMPNGDVPAHVGVGYAAATSNSIYSVTGSAAWQFEDISYPASNESGSSVGRIEDGIRFRNVREIFAWQSFTRVYNYVW